MSDDEVLSEHMMVCLCCGDRLLSACRDRATPDYPPSNATVWHSRGNFGSKVFDPGTNLDHWLEAYVCDSCLKERIERVYTVNPEPVKQEDNVYRVGVHHDRETK